MKKSYLFIIILTILTATGVLSASRSYSDRRSALGIAKQHIVDTYEPELERRDLLVEKRGSSYVYYNIRDKQTVTIENDVFLTDHIDVAAAAGDWLAIELVYMAFVGAALAGTIYYRKSIDALFEVMDSYIGRIN